MATGIGRDSLEAYFRLRLGGCRLLGVRELGRGAHGAGFLVELDTEGGRREFVLKSVAPEGLGHDYPPDRAAMHLMALDTFGDLPGHVKALDVLSLGADGALKPIGGGLEYYLLMERAEGVSYFRDLDEFAKKESLDAEDRGKISAMAALLAEIHSVRKDSRTLYLRKLRDIIGHGECLMGVFDTYPIGPESVLGYGEMADIEKRCIEWRARLKDRWHRLRRIHGDFHPGNIWFGESAHADRRGTASLRLLDRSRGPWGEPADDVTALTINYVFFSVRHFNELRGPYAEGLERFFREYIGLTGDEEILEVLAPFYAFRGAVVANPVFYPELGARQRGMIFTFVKNVLRKERFDPGGAAECLAA